jgi:hypothetical protein
MNIALTEFWIDRPFTTSDDNFTIFSERWQSFSRVYYGFGRALIHNNKIGLYQLSCVVLDDTFYIDFSATQLKDFIAQQIWILKHTKGIEYKIKFTCIWEKFNLPTVEQLNDFAKLKHGTQEQNTGVNLESGNSELLR